MVPHSIVRLGHEELVAERPFTHPEQSAGDLRQLRAMARTVRSWADRLVPGVQAQPLILYLREPAGNRHRILLADLPGLWACEEATVVGFFGTKRSDIDAAMLNAVDAALNYELLHHPLLLSYSSVELADGNWANLVMMRHPEGIDSWAASSRHAYAARELAPRYYEGIRLHNATLPQGLAAIEELRLLRTKYYDFADNSFWHAVREEKGPSREPLV